MNWIKNNKKVGRYEKCPKCGSTNFDYSSLISNYVDVIMYSADAIYKTQFKCSDCGYEEAVNE